MTVNRKDLLKIPTYDLTAVEIAVRPAGNPGRDDGDASDSGVCADPVRGGAQDNRRTSATRNPLTSSHSTDRIMRGMGSSSASAK
jgi:hypothetical protein